MAERRPSLKRPGITATGRQWRTVEALRADGWFVLEADPLLWSDEEAERVAAACRERGIGLAEDEDPRCAWCKGSGQRVVYRPGEDAATGHFPLHIGHCLVCDGSGVRRAAREEGRRYEARLQELIASGVTRDGWDGGAANGVPPTVFDRARLLLRALCTRVGLPEPWIGPTVTGGLPLEWQAKGAGLSLDIDVSPEGEFSAQVVDEGDPSRRRGRRGSVEATLELAAAVYDHERNHLTDGRWHDKCSFCLRRRVEGGTGVPITEAPDA